MTIVSEREIFRNKGIRPTYFADYILEPGVLNRPYLRGQFGDIIPLNNWMLN